MPEIPLSKENLLVKLYGFWRRLLWKVAALLASKDWSNLNTRLELVLADYATVPFQVGMSSFFGIDAERDTGRMRMQRNSSKQRFHAKKTISAEKTSSQLIRSGNRLELNMVLQAP